MAGSPTPGFVYLLRTEFPRLPICLLMDGLYPVKSVFDIGQAHHWKFIATLREGRQPTAYDEAVQTMMMCPSQVFQGQREGEDGPVDQTLRWTHDIPFGSYEFPVLFSGEIRPTAATLWVWITNLFLSPDQMHRPLANCGSTAQPDRMRSRSFRPNPPASNDTPSSDAPRTASGLCRHPIPIFTSFPTLNRIPP